MKRLPEISLHPLAPAGIFLVLFALPKNYAFAVVFVSFIHECGHAAAGILLGEKIEKITIMPVGISMQISRARSYAEEIITAAAGPVQNIFCLIFSRFFACQAEIRSFALISLAINLLPVGTLDGGRILHAAVSLFFGEDTGKTVLDVCGTICLFFVWMIGVYIFFYTAENAALLIFCSYIFARVILFRRD